MLDVITDFWRPTRKAVAAIEHLKPEDLKIGGRIGFGLVPQTSISGRQLKITGVNTYQFGNELLTSFVLSQERDPGISMIVGDLGVDQYLALSRRIPPSDRIKLFDPRELEMMMEPGNIEQFACKDPGVEFKGWTVPFYKRKTQGMNGVFYQGDFRKAPPLRDEGQVIAYTLLVSDSNEHAIEIEKYADGRIEVYATAHRRLSDIIEIEQPVVETLSLVSANSSLSAAEVLSAPEILRSVGIAAPAMPLIEVPAMVFEEKILLPVVELPAIPPTPLLPTPPIEPLQEKLIMTAATHTASNFSAEAENAFKPKFSPNFGSNNSVNAESAPVRALVQAPEPSAANEAIECDLRVANKLIDEAIRNEMRLSDVVRRIIELPLSSPESVQIPIALSDEDFSLLAIRYGIVATDRNAIKRRIIEDMNNFSGAGKK